MVLKEVKLTYPADESKKRLDMLLFGIIRTTISHHLGRGHDMAKHYRFIDDCVYQIYGLRKRPKERTLDFIRDKILPIDDYKKQTELERMILSYTY